MATSGVEELSMRLLEAFHDLAEGRLQRPVPKEDAARAADMDESSTEPDVALRYLLNGGYVEAIGQTDDGNANEAVESYVITVSGMDKVRQRRGA